MLHGRLEKIEEEMARMLPSTWYMYLDYSVNNNVTVK